MTALSLYSEVEAAGKPVTSSAGLALVVDSASAAALVSSDSSADIVDRMRRRNVSCAAKTRTLPVPSEQYSED